MAADPIQASILPAPRPCPLCFDRLPLVNEPGVPQDIISVLARHFESSCTEVKAPRADPRRDGPVRIRESWRI